LAACIKVLPVLTSTRVLVNTGSTLIQAAKDE